MGGLAKGIGALAGTLVGGPVLGAALGGVGGAVKQNQQRAEFNRQKELAAKTAQYSPWTGMDAMSMMPRKAPSAFENIGGGLIGGALQGSEWAKNYQQNPVAGSEQVKAGSGQGSSLFDLGVPRSVWQGVPTLYGQRQPDMKRS